MASITTTKTALWAMKAGLRKLIEACETALLKGQWETQWLDYQHVVKIDTPPEAGGTASGIEQDWKDKLFAMGCLVGIVAFVASVPIGAWTMFQMAMGLF